MSHQTVIPDFHPLAEGVMSFLASCMEEWSFWQITQIEISQGQKQKFLFVFDLKKPDSQKYCRYQTSDSSVFVTDLVNELMSDHATQFCELYSVEDFSLDVVSNDHKLQSICVYQKNSKGEFFQKTI